MKNIVDKIVNKAKDFAKNNIAKPLIVGAVGVASIASSYAQTGNEPTPMSTYGNIMSRPYIAASCGADSSDCYRSDLDWDNLSKEEKSDFFKEAFKEKHMPLFNRVLNTNGDSVIQYAGKTCGFYRDLAIGTFYGFNGIDALELNEDDAKEIIKENNGGLNLPVLGAAYRTETQAHLTPSIFIDSEITQNTNATSFKFSDGQTGYDADPGTVFMPYDNNITISHHGYRGGTNFDPIKLFHIKLNGNGSSEMDFISPKVITKNPKKIQLNATLPGEVEINYNSNWQNENFGDFNYSTNLNLDETIETDDGANSVKIGYEANISEDFSEKTHLLEGEAGNYNFKVKRKSLVDILQKGINYSTGYQKDYILKSDSASQYIFVRDTEDPIGNFSENAIQGEAGEDVVSLAEKYFTATDNAEVSNVEWSSSKTNEDDNYEYHTVKAEAFDHTGNSSITEAYVDLKKNSVGIGDIKENSKLLDLVMQNPITGSNPYINIVSKNPEKTKVEGFDISGRKMLEVQGDNFQNYDFGNLNDGVYIFRATDAEGNSETKKIEIRFK